MSPTAIRRARVGACLVLAGLLAACAAGRPGIALVRGGGGDAAWLTGTWQGGYHCALGYGDARMTLTLEGHTNGRMDGELAFQVVEPLTKIPPGRFRVAGALDPGGAFHLQGTRWIDWPEGLSLFGLEGHADPQRGGISGTVPACGAGSTFYIEKITEPE